VPRRRRPAFHRPSHRPWLEALEDSGLLSAGALDPTFGNGAGYVTTAVTNYNSFANAVRIQPDGKIIAAGTTNTGTSDNFAVARYNNAILLLLVILLFIFFTIFLLPLLLLVFWPYAALLLISGTSRLQPAGGGIAGVPPCGAAEFRLTCRRVHLYTIFGVGPAAVRIILERGS
jgi:hypothetical protein